MPRFLADDLRGALRGIRRHPGFSAAVVATLALAIGALSAVFSGVHAVLLRPLPYRDPGRLVMLWRDLRSVGRAEPEWLSFPDFADWRDGSKTLEATAAFTGWQAIIPGDDEPERVPGGAVSSSYFTVLGVAPLAGRTFQEGEDAPGAAGVVVLSEGLWRRKFGADPGIVGRAVTINDEPWTVIGIVPASFAPPASPAQLWRPLGQSRFVPPCGRGCISLRAIGRLRPGVTAEAAQAELTAITRRAATEDPEIPPTSGAWVVPLHTQLVGDVRLPLLVLVGAVALVLLLACVNLANLLLVRGTRRAGEVAVRLALGADRRRIRAQLLTEHLVLALLGGALGLAVAASGTGVLRALIPARVASVTTVSIDWQVVAFTAVVSVVAGLLFGALPAARASEVQLSEVLRDDTRGATGGRREHRSRDLLVVVQFALALTLLTTAGLLMRSFVNLSRTDIGFAPGQLHAVELQLPRGRYRAPQEPVRFFEALVDRLRALPGVQAVGATSIAPLGNGDRNFSFHKEGEPPPDRPTGNGPALWHRQVTPDYFAAMRIALRAGRVFTREDGAESPAVAVINEAAAHQYWPGRSAVGERIYIDGPGGGSEPATIVGVVANVRHDGQSAPVKPEVFVPLAQSPARGMTVMVRGAGDPVALSSAVRGAIRELDRAIPVGPVTPMVSRYAESVALPRLFTWLFAAFGAAALALASVGIYGVVSYGVATRRREFGVRMAVGAEPSRILAMVLRQGAALALAGAAAGVLGSIAAGRAVRALLVGVGAADPASLTMATLTLLAVGACAVLIPARRAMRTDPVAALRSG